MTNTVTSTRTSTAPTRTGNAGSSWSRSDGRRSISNSARSRWPRRRPCSPGSVQGHRRADDPDRRRRTRRVARRRAGELRRRPGCGGGPAGDVQRFDAGRTRRRSSRLADRRLVVPGGPHRRPSPPELALRRQPGRLPAPAPDPSRRVRPRRPIDRRGRRPRHPGDRACRRRPSHRGRPRSAAPRDNGGLGGRSCDRRPAEQPPHRRGR